MRVAERWAPLRGPSRPEPEIRRLVYAGWELAPPRCRFLYRYERATFSRVLTFGGIPEAAFAAADPALLDRLLGHIGLAYAPQLFAVADFTHLAVERLPLSPGGVEFFADLLRHGLGELRYRNGIDLAREVVIEAPPCAGGGAVAVPAGNGALLFGGGGKDSAVGAAALAAAGVPFAWLLVNPSGAARATALAGVGSTAGEPAEILEVASAGTPLRASYGGRRRLHGHRPFNSFLAFVGLAAAYLCGRRYVVASNERSANLPTLVHEGFPVNHQHTKSLDFESRLRAYVAADLVAGISYFSVLRPLWEIEIGRLFADLPRFHGAVVSCNRGLYAGSWCLACPKCAFVFLLLAAFLPPAEVAAILGADPAEAAALRPAVALLTCRERRPFDCVGTLGECRLALHLAAARGYEGLARQAGWEVPGGAEAAALAAVYLEGGGERPQDHIPEEMRERVLAFFGRSS